MKEEILNSFLKLNISDKFEIVQILWETLEESKDFDEISLEQKNELLKRWDRLNAEGNKGRDWQEVLGDITKIG